MSDDDKKKVIQMDEMLERPVLSDLTQAPIIKAMRKFTKIVDGPVEWFRVNIVERFRGPKYYYYHQNLRRVPTIDQCYTDDQACIYEANQQYIRDKRVDDQILNILRHRFFNCVYYERNVNTYYNHQELCPKERKDLDDAHFNYFVKYGDIGPFTSVIDAFMKQKHRLIHERRQALKESAQN